ncbi:NAD(P)H-binding protein [Mucilaginibacter sp. SMC90]|uniref:SDR family oxidoreductase n=1 Tax=Mucilaginibacter sp. SMC90 TaxID=2929803 RepID=UPI001FB30F35|nr:NAD(P)H-binding protein [Mucilaginibacter sp. SMC90]UOE48821.1 NAD(P)H-binding protein [Mucilaginibacter sp. SMC90]
MKFLIIGGTGLIGSKVSQELQNAGHTVFAASPSAGINAITGEGLDAAFEGTDVVLDLINSATFEDEPVMDFFRTASANLVRAGKKADIGHYLVLSIVGIDLMQKIGYMKAKKVQEDTVKLSGIPYTIVRSTQFHEFVPTLTSIATQGTVVHLSKLDFQPIAAADVASLIARFALEEPANTTIDIAGPDRKGMDLFAEDYLKAGNDQRTVIANNDRVYIAAPVPQSALVPAGEAYTGKTSFSQWLASNAAKN